MTLASQSARPGRTAGPGATPPRTRSRFGGRGPVRTIAIAVAAVAALGGGIWLMSHLGGPKSAAADPPSGTEPTGTLTAHPTAPDNGPATPPSSTSSLAGGRSGAGKPGTLQPQPPATPPVVLDMNRRPDAPAAPPPAPAHPSPAQQGGGAGAPSYTPPAPPPSMIGASETTADIQTLIQAGQKAKQDNKF